MSVREILSAVTAGLLLGLGPAGPVMAQGERSPTAGDFGFDDVYLKALELAESPYQPDRPPLPAGFQDLQYDHYRDIRFRPEKSVWRDEARFRLQLFSRGFLYRDRVRINLIDAEGSETLAFSRDMFDFGKNEVPPGSLADMGFAGFRILYPLHGDERYDEVAVFLGASYFRAIGQQQSYGISARGLAIDTGLDTPEEFPVFREFWIRKPPPNGDFVEVFALLDSERATGAYQFRIHPGQDTVVDVTARIKLRRPVEKLGIAPLTSMFYHGESTDRFFDDFRPEVHDSDGLSIAGGSGERIWRPLNNPKSLQITAFDAENTRGFGLLQRDRDFDHYQDTEAVYHQRPSAWVETVGDWGKGAVELVEIPTDSERNDNIVAFWTPATPVEPGSPLHVEYRLHFSLNPEAQLKGGRTLATRIGAGGTDVPDYSRRKVVLDFSGPAIESLDPENPNVQPVCNASSGEIAQQVAHHNRFTGGWRLFFELVPESDSAADVRCFLRRGRDVLTETWVYRWLPN